MSTDDGASRIVSKPLAEWWLEKEESLRVGSPAWQARQAVRREALLDMEVEDFLATFHKVLNIGNPWLRPDASGECPVEEIPLGTIPSARADFRDAVIARLEAEGFVARHSGTGTFTVHVSRPHRRVQPNQ